MSYQSSFGRDRASDLVGRIASGQDDALRELYVLYGQRLYAHAVRITRSPAVAEDVLQESLLAVWRGASGFRGEGRVLAWLLGIVHHKALNAIRGRLPASCHEQPAQVADAGPALDELVAQEERREWLKAALERLSVEHRAVLELVFYQGLSLSEVAQVSDCPVGTVKSRLHYAKSQLRGELVGRGIGAKERP
jgi:RNA polymerase sigma-70 factor (ECF subfamily)